MASTLHALILNTESICVSIDNNEFGCGIFINLEKRFRYSYYNHSLAITKLKAIMELEAMRMNGLN